MTDRTTPPMENADSSTFSAMSAQRAPVVPLAPPKAADIERVQRLARVSLLAACALVLSYIETMIPLPVAIPGIKLGLANIAVVVALFTLDIKSAAAVCAIKVLASGFLFGSPMMLAYSLGGSALAFVGMTALSLVPGVGLVPVSMLAAVLHNAGQLGVAALALGTPSVFVNMGVLGIAACVTGGITGAVAEGALASLEGEYEEARPQVPCAEFAASIVPGERIAFVGPNGSGKSTCALQLAGLLGHEGAEVAHRHAGVIFQDPDNQIVAPIVRDDAAFGLENRGECRADMIEAVDDALRNLDIADLRVRTVTTLSGGQKQRVAAAGVGVLAPELVIFDETTSMLDDAARTSIDNQIRALCTVGVTVIQITQILDEAARADRIVVFEDSRIAAVDTPAQIKTHSDLLARCGLEELCR